MGGGLGGQPLAAGLGLSWGLGQPASQTGLEATLASRLGVGIGQPTNPPESPIWRSGRWLSNCNFGATPEKKYHLSNKAGAWL